LERDRLAACVNDAKQWMAWLQSQGFTVELLLDSQATERGICDRLKDLIDSAQPGSILVVQYSGHGTQFPDDSGDEHEGQDEALVPFDHRENGKYIIDDDLAELAAGLRSGVSLTFLMDCCHSGSNTRLLVGPVLRPAPGVRVRYLQPDEEMLAAHRRTRAAPRGSHAARDVGGVRHEVLFSACRPDQTAKERAGHGDFTRWALTVLRSASPGLTNAGFMDALKTFRDKFQDQNPQLWADASLRGAPMFGGVSRALAANALPQDSPTSLRGTLAEIERLLGELRRQIG